MLGATRLLGEGLSDGAGSEDHALLLSSAGEVLGVGYNRYRQAAPHDARLRLSSPARIPPGLLLEQRVVAVAVGGGAAFARARARERLAARCVAALSGRLRADDARVAVDVLAVAAACHAPGLASLAAAVAAAAARGGAEAAALPSRRGVSVEHGLRGLRQMRADAGGDD